jgi:peptidoglycan/xylan/chitin deacetylase (PgdA/CDA1 family)
LYLVKSPYLLSKLSSKSILWKENTIEKLVYFTFDDGPIPEITPLVLDLLDKYNAKATFFMVGENVLKYPDIYQKVISSGHEIGNHTFNHLKGFSTKDFIYYRNIVEASKYIDSKLFRPPHGQITPKKIKSISKHYQIVMWSILSGDYDPKTTPKQCLRNIISNVQNGSIIVMHDSLKAENNMLFALEESLKQLSRLGYRFESLKQPL